MDYRSIEKACEAQRDRNNPPPEGYEQGEVIYLTAQDVLDEITTNDQMLSIMTDMLNSDLAWQAYRAIDDNDALALMVVMKQARKEEAQFRADKTNKCREEGLAEFNANHAEWLETDR